MSDIYVQFILDGRTTYADAVYLFYYRFPSVADKVVRELQDLLIVEDREDLLVEPDIQEQIIAQAKSDRKKYIEKFNASKQATPAVQK